MNQLYLVVIDFFCYGERQEAEWLHFVSDQEQVQEQAEKLARQHLKDNLDLTDDDIELDNVWVNKVDSVDGFAVKVERS